MGTDPTDDDIGFMTAVGDGVYTMDFDIEDYYTNPTTINTSWNDTHTVQSTLMPAGQCLCYGLVFSDPAALIQEGMISVMIYLYPVLSL